jgi:hypothetical protein
MPGKASPILSSRIEDANKENDRLKRCSSAR